MPRHVVCLSFDFDAMSVWLGEERFAVAQCTTMGPSFGRGRSSQGIRPFGMCTAPGMWPSSHSSSSRTSRTRGGSREPIRSRSSDGVMTGKLSTGTPAARHASIPPSRTPRRSSNPMRINWRIDASSSAPPRETRTRGARNGRSQPAHTTSGAIAAIPYAPGTCPRMNSRGARTSRTAPSESAHAFTSAGDIDFGRGSPPRTSGPFWLIGRTFPKYAG